MKRSDWLTNKKEPRPNPGATGNSRISAGIKTRSNEVLRERIGDFTARGRLINEEITIDTVKRTYRSGNMITEVTFDLYGNQLSTGVLAQSGEPVNPSENTQAEFERLTESTNNINRSFDRLDMTMEEMSREMDELFGRREGAIPGLTLTSGHASPPQTSPGRMGAMTSGMGSAADMSMHQELINFAHQISNRAAVEREGLPHDRQTATSRRLAELDSMRSGEPIAPALRMIREGEYIDNSPGPKKIPFVQRMMPWLFKGNKNEKI